jgi:hypothetical protein
MSEGYEERLQRAKNKLDEERARRKSREGLQDDASYSSQISKASRTSFASEYSRASSKVVDTRLLPRSEWRNKARAVIERGKYLKEQEAEMRRDDGSHPSRKQREDRIDSLVERHAHLNERERMLKVECDLLDAAEAEAKRERIIRAESYLGRGIDDDEVDEMLNADYQQHFSTTRTTATSRAKRIPETEADDLNRSFNNAKAVWLGRCNDKTDKTGSSMDDITPVKSNSYRRIGADHSKSSPVARSRYVGTDTYSEEADLNDYQISPAASVKSTKLSRSMPSQSERWSGNESNTVRSSLDEARLLLHSAKSDSTGMATETKMKAIIRSESMLMRDSPEENGVTGNTHGNSRDRRSSISNHQELVDPPTLYARDNFTEGDPSQSYRVQSSSASASSQSRKLSRHHSGNMLNDDFIKCETETGRNQSNRVKSSSASVSSQKSQRTTSSTLSASSKGSKHSSKSIDAEPVLASSASLSSQRSKYSYSSSHRDREAMRRFSPASISSQRSSRRDMSSKKPIRSNSVSSQRSRRSHRHDELSEEPDDEDYASMLPEELTIPMIIADLDNVENQAPTRKRELSYREKSAILATMGSTVSDERCTDEDGPLVDRSVFRQHGQKSKLHQLQQQGTRTVGKNRGVETRGQSPSMVPALKEQKNLYNTKPERSIVGDSSGPTTQQESASLKLSNLINENRELKARFEKERIRRAEMDDKAATLQLEVHQKGQEISQLKERKDVSEAHKEQLFKMEDECKETNRRLQVLVEDNVQLRAALEEERARRERLEAQAKQVQSKLKKRSEEVVSLAKELKKKEDRYGEALQEESHLREIAESQLAKACHHINTKEKGLNEELEQLETENSELRHKVERLEVYLRQKLEQERRIKAKSRRQSVGSHQDAISSKATWTTAVSEITTDFEFEELIESQMGEI